MSNIVKNGNGIHQNVIVNELVRKNNLIQKLIPYFILSKRINASNGFEMLSSLPTLNNLADLISPKSHNSDHINNNNNNNNNNGLNKNSLAHNNNVVHGVHPYSKPSPPRRSPTPATALTSSANSPVTPDQNERSTDT
ncbi:UNVERIFIED_CONTAM: hypothetical protein PYX00_009816 [Menopon gallinae]|uniref:Uncharacterized protein n=1 Tax=Menopon gallinae TaxID=328185 RepID=A0AAW2HD76_9NEOP